MPAEAPPGTSLSAGKVPAFLETTSNTHRANKQANKDPKIEEFRLENCEREIPFIQEKHQEENREKSELTGRWAGGSGRGDPLGLGDRLKLSPRLLGMVSAVLGVQEELPLPSLGAVLGLVPARVRPAGSARCRKPKPNRG